MVTAAEFGTGQVLWSMVWFFLFVIWLWLLFVVFGDIFRSRDLSGWGKGLWTVFIVVLPYLGVFVYIVARGHKMGERAREDAKDRDAAFREYVQGVASPNGHSTAEEIARLQELRTQGVLTEVEFQQAKAKALTG